MRVIKRFMHLARADAHGLLDSIEDRSLILKQHLRDAELELERKRLYLEKLTQRVERLTRRQAALEERVAELDRDVSLSMSRGEDKLARFVIRRLLSARKSREALAAERAETAAELERTATITGEQEAAYRELVAKVEAELAELRAREQRASAKESVAAACGAEARELEQTLGVLDEEVELEWLRRRATSEAGEVGS